MAKAPAENHFYNLLRLNDGGLGTITPDVAYWPKCEVPECPSRNISPMGCIRINFSPGNSQKIIEPTPDRLREVDGMLVGFASTSSSPL